jgi:RHS repeat-associated protein
MGAKCYLYDMHLPYGQVVAEYNSNGSLIADYGFGLDRISMRRGGTTYTYLADGQGSIRALTNSQGSVTDTYDYFAFGEVLNRTGTTINEFTYTGEQWDPNAGFYYLRARWYDPARGRFASVDPYEGDPQSPISLHRYLYGNASPVSFSDPMGLFGIGECMMTIAVNNILAVNVTPVRGTQKNTKKYRVAIYVENLFDPETNVTWPLIDGDLASLQSYLEEIATIRGIDFKFKKVTRDNLISFLSEGDRNGLMAHGSSPDESEPYIFSRFHVGGETNPNQPDESTMIPLFNFENVFKPNSRTFLSGCFAGLLASGNLHLYGIAGDYITFPEAVYSLKQEMRFMIWSGK